VARTLLQKQNVHFADHFSSTALGHHPPAFWNTIGMEAVALLVFLS
jgi:hypothetical protein